jgi:hypothetical protein
MGVKIGKFQDDCRDVFMLPQPQIIKTGKLAGLTVVGVLRSHQSDGTPEPLRSGLMRITDQGAVFWPEYDMTPDQAGKRHIADIDETVLGVTPGSI